MRAATTDVSQEGVGAIEERVFDAHIVAEGFVVAVRITQNVKSTVDQEETDLGSGSVVFEIATMAIEVFTNLFELVCDLRIGEEFGSSKLIYGIGNKEITGIHNGGCHEIVLIRRDK